MEYELDFCDVVAFALDERYPKEFRVTLLRVMAGPDQYEELHYAFIGLAAVIEGWQAKWPKITQQSVVAVV